jgi:hypothetical protein
MERGGNKQNKNEVRVKHVWRNDNSAKEEKETSM